MLEGAEPNLKIAPDITIHLNEVYFDFINEYPDYGPKSKMTISRQKFYKWINAYCVYKTGEKPQEGRDLVGKWIVISAKEEDLDNDNTDYIEF